MKFPSAILLWQPMGVPALKFHLLALLGAHLLALLAAHLLALLGVEPLALLGTYLLALLGAELFAPPGAHLLVVGVHLLELLMEFLLLERWLEKPHVALPVSDFGLLKCFSRSRIRRVSHSEY